MEYCTGLSAPEGPVALAKGEFLVVEMGAERGCVSHLTENAQQRREIARTGRPNGLATDADGAIWIAETNPPAVLKMDMSGNIEVVCTSYLGSPLLFPNDLCFGPDGMLYFTDSGISVTELSPDGFVRRDWNEVEYKGAVYRLDPKTGEMKQLFTGIRFTNGIAFGPRDQHLYIAETLGGNIWRCEWSPERVGPLELWANTDPDEPLLTFHGPDGMKFAQNGDLYVAVYAQGEVVVLDPSGRVKQRIATDGNQPTNLVFGAGDETAVYVTETETGTLQKFEVGIAGLPLHNGAPE
ncbi:SMP-30/gluconolactonase/LRE family protein [Rhizobium miluonense]|uniref:Gluconolactonase n=1 Tax=Rhizobium miluonense TaxID=411945 RepID=A0A1C3V797_9HYPH|nr:SMP-30/gluconolactonase/LRE family protein [Rhizobium miluonense]SCB23680.1 gluconolactonase [Rhizobium miluonense]